MSRMFTVKGSAEKVGLDYMPEMGPVTPEQEENAPCVVYKKSIFNAKNEVFFDIARQPMDSRCYFCHSMRRVDRENLYKEEAYGREFFKTDADVHSQAGMRCVDCHRNGEDHKIRRGYEREIGTELDPCLATLSCKGCHLGESGSAGGRLGAPKPLHKGIPPLHFKKLTCTACHSGPYPKDVTNFVQTSQSHGLEFQGTHRGNDTVPLIVEPVYAKRTYDGKIGPQRMVWPSYWAREKEGKVKPIKAEKVVEKAKVVFDGILEERAEDNAKKAKAEGAAHEGKKKYLTEERIAAILEILNQDAENEGQAAYVSGGKLYRRIAEGKLEASDHAAAEPVSWPIGHNVRPATESLGAKGCLECHAQGAPFHFGQVEIPTLADLPVENVPMHAFLKLDRQELEEWAWTYQFRTLFKIIGYAAGAVIALVLLAYGMYGVRGLSDWARRHLSPGGRSE